MNWNAAGLFLLGIVVGRLVNFSIYRFCWTDRPIGPWPPRPEKVPKRRWFDQIPLAGWITLRRESEVHGRGYWVRPLLIELAMGIGFVALWQWMAEGGQVPQRVGLVPPAPSALLQRLLAQLTLISFLVAATFIDFDEKTIPDEITIPGTLIGLIFAAVFWSSRLPAIEMDKQPPYQLQVISLHCGHPLTWPTQLDGPRGLGYGCLIFAIWCVVLLPWLIRTRYGWQCPKYMWAGLIRPRRKTPGPEETRDHNRHLRRTTWQILAIAVIGELAIFVVWYWWPGPAWQGLLSSLIGLAFGGGIVWSVRVVGSLAMRQEAMGFGDVTLMCMIGSFLGWQTSLLVFMLAPFAAVVIGLCQLILIRNTEIAFGPYLSLAALAAIVFWRTLWHGWSEQMFSLGTLIPWLMAACLLLMGGMLYSLRLLKQALGWFDPKNSYLPWY